MSSRAGNRGALMFHRSRLCDVCSRGPADAIDRDMYLTKVRHHARPRLPRPPLQPCRHLRGRRARHFIPRTRAAAGGGARAQRDRSWPLRCRRDSRLSRSRFRSDEPAAAQSRGRRTGRNHGACRRCTLPRRHADTRRPARVHSLRGAVEQAGRRLPRATFATRDAAGGDGHGRLGPDARTRCARRDGPAERRSTLLSRRVLCRARPPLQAGL